MKDRTVVNFVLAVCDYQAFSVVYDQRFRSAAEELRGHSSVNSTEKIQLVDSRTKFIQQLSYPPSLFLLIAILKRYSIPYVDNTSRGGAFWIDGDLDSLKWLIDGLTSIGFSCRFIAKRRKKNLPKLWITWP